MLAAYIIRVGLYIPPRIAFRTVSIMFSFDLLWLEEVSRGSGNPSGITSITSLVSGRLNVALGDILSVVSVDGDGNGSTDIILLDVVRTFHVNEQFPSRD